MSSITRNDESFVERDEVLFPSSDFVDTEPFYTNFTTIQNALRHREEHRQVNIVSNFSSFFSYYIKLNTCLY